ncbi:MAG: peptidylprolyl isomerase, partial [Planctomycetaceae bacterium]|nr:peptidylprolyl isomerase [Planctomycetaceae bacterium]
SNQLFNNVSDATSTVQMFVNGQINRDYDNYIVQPDDEIVIVYGSNPVVSMNTNFGSMVIELFPEQTPITVNNFLNYINGTTQNGGNYDGTFFHRGAEIAGEEFVIQAGGFTTPTESFTDADQFQSIVTDPAITNEPGISNLRGTIAMAKLGGDPNSATSQFFVNLSDSNAGSPASLDTQNGGFTMFGQVLDLTTADRIAAIPTDDKNTNSTTAFNELPVTTDDRLAIIESFTGQGSITGVKFQDTNQDGTQDPGEAGIGGVRVFIDTNNNGMFDAGELSTLTDADGRFLLQTDPGTQIVRAEVSSGAMQTAPTSPDSHIVDVVLGRVVEDLLFGEF